MATSSRTQGRRRLQQHQQSLLSVRRPQKPFLPAVANQISFKQVQRQDEIGMKDINSSTTKERTKNLLEKGSARYVNDNPEKTVQEK
jgi:hypothetical protein